jgi:L-iditol 2-dehydrogenase
MRTARLHAAGDVRLHDEPDPVVRPDEELVRVTAVGLCGSDRHWFLDGAIGDADLSHPLVLGHEISGVIASGPRAGMRVAVDPANPCGTCEVCAADLAHLCPRTRFAGHGTNDGGLRTLMAWPSRLLAPVPDEIGDPEASLLEPLGVALHAVDLGKVRSGMRAGVFGCGPIGLLLIGALREIGAEIVLATDALPHRRAAAAAFGAREVRPPDPDGSPTLTPSLDVSFEVAGEDAAVREAMTAVRPGGRVVLVGIPSPDQTTFPASLARRKGLTILVSRRMRADDLDRAILFAGSRSLGLGSLVTARHSLDQAPEAFAELSRQGGLKVVVEPSS